MPLVTVNVNGDPDVRHLAAELLTAVLHHPQNVAREAGRIEQIKPMQTMGSPSDQEEVWEVLTAVAGALRHRAAHGHTRRPVAEIQLLRHLAARQH